MTSDRLITDVVIISYFRLDCIVKPSIARAFIKQFKGVVVLKNGGVYNMDNWGQGNCQLIAPRSLLERGI